MTPYRPMLATPWAEAFSDLAWSFELKWDGVRAVLHSGAGAGELRSRNGNVISARYPELAVPDLGMVLDGEVVAMDETGRPSFDRLQGRMGLRGLGDQLAPVHFIVFDLLAVNGKDMRASIYDERRARLSECALPPGFVVGDATVGEGEALFSAVRDEGLEGMVAKRRTSIYQSAVRSPDWRKILNRRTVTAVVGGYLPSETGRPLRSLLLGLWDGDRLRYVGSVGSGFDDASLGAIRAALDEMATDQLVFWPDPALEQAVVVEPMLVAHVRYRTWTTAGRLRHTVFGGFGDEDPARLTWLEEGPSVSQ